MSKPAHTINPHALIPDPRSVASLAELARMRDAIAAAWREQLEAHVMRARLTGATWTQVGRALGMSRQAATKKFQHLEGFPVTIGYTVEDGRRQPYVECAAHPVVSRVFLPERRAQWPVLTRKMLGELTATASAPQLHGQVLDGAAPVAVPAEVWEHAPTGATSGRSAAVRPAC